MPTIVEYTDTQSPQNQYPYHIISPSHASPCCFAAMEAVGPAEPGARWVSQFKRCRTCGFTVRVVVRELPDEGLLASLRKILSTSFQRNVPDY
jgi:hypothetical protein